MYSRNLASRLTTLSLLQNPSWESECAMKIVIGADHAGFQMKNAVGDLLRSLGHTVLDVGAFNENPSDYPDFAVLVGKAVLEGKGERGILFAATLTPTPLPQIRMPRSRGSLP